MTREALSAFLPSNFWPVLRFQQYDYLHTRIIHSEIIPLIYLPCCISELLRNFHILKFVRTCVHSRENGELWRTWLTYSYLSLIGELTPQYVIFWNGSYERGRFPHLPPSSSWSIKSWIQHETHTWRHIVLEEQLAPVFREGWNWSKVFDGSLLWWNFMLDNV